MDGVKRKILFDSYGGLVLLYTCALGMYRYSIKVPHSKLNQPIGGVRVRLHRLVL